MVYQCTIDRIRFRLRETADSFTDVAIVDAQKLSKDIGVETAKVVRSLRDLDKISGEIRREFNSQGFVKSVVLLPKFFETFKKRGLAKEDEEPSSDQSVPVIKPALVVRKVRPPIDFFLAEMQGEIIKRRTGSKLYREIFAAFYVIEKILYEASDGEFDVVTNMLTNLSSERFHSGNNN